MQDLLVRSGRPVLVALTKGDKLTRSAQAARPRELAAALGLHEDRSSSPAARPGWGSPIWPTASSPPWEVPDEDSAPVVPPARPGGTPGSPVAVRAGGHRGRSEPSARRVRLAHPERPGSQHPDARRGGSLHPAGRAGHPTARAGQLGVAPLGARIPAGGDRLRSPTPRGCRGPASRW
jgi:Predicted GTPase